MDFQIVQAFFMLGFVAMAAGTLWFYLERNDLKPELRSVATYAAVITFVAAIMYYVMKDIVQFPGGVGIIFSVGHGISKSEHSDILSLQL